MLLVSALLAMHLNWLLAVRLLSFSFHAGLIVFVWQFVRQRSGTFAAVFSTALVTASWPMLIWDLGGLEAVPFAALLCVGTLLTLRYLESAARRDIILGGLFLGLAGFMRPDGGVIAFIALAACLLAAKTPLKRRLTDVLLGAICCAVIVIPWLIFRLRFYHDYLPNTYYAKIYGISLSWRMTQGWGYWRGYIFKAPYLVVMDILVFALLLLSKRVRRFDLALAACILGHGLYIVDNGGDHMKAFRFMVPLIPLLAVAIAAGLAQLGAYRSNWGAAAVSGVLLLASARQATLWMQNPITRDFAGLVGQEVGVYINTHWKPGSLVSLNVAGATPFFADDLNYIDSLGLNDRIIARRNPVPIHDMTLPVGHIKGDGKSILDRHPDYIIIGMPSGNLITSGDRLFLSEFEMAHLPAFAQGYKACRQMIPLSPFARAELDTPSQQIPFTYYQRRDLTGPCPPAE
jgi:arabinofuranosyltransferase